MKRTTAIPATALVAALVLSPLHARAQQTFSPAGKQALEQTVIELTGDKLAWREKAIEGDARAKAAEAKVQELQKQLDECKKP